MEVADAIVVTKADVDSAAANRSVATLAGELRYMSHADTDRITPVLSCSSLSGEGIDEVVRQIELFFDHARSEHVLRRRRHQRGEWFDRAIGAELIARLTDQGAFHAACESMRSQCIEGTVAPSLAVHRLLGRVQLIVSEEPT
jgi:LAO/AO transport system kinase